MNTNFNPKNAYALVVGIDDYNSIAVNNLSCASNDANLLYEYLKTFGGYNRTI